MIWFFYNILFLLGFALVLPHYLWRMRRRGGYAKNFWQRIGSYDDEVKAGLSRGGWVWVHAVSVGELFIALKLIRELRSLRPDERFLLSVTTSTAYALAEKELADPDRLIYFPLDTPWVTHRVLNLVRPKALILMECEIWPNLIRLARRTGATVCVVNARISDKSYRGYQKVRFLFSRIIRLMDLVCAQSQRDAERLVELGASPDAVQVMGSAKYDVASSSEHDAEPARAVLHAAGVAEDDLVLLGGSTWPGEERILARIYRELLHSRKKLVLVLVPRHAERAPEVLRELEDEGLRVVLRSELDTEHPLKDISEPLLLLVNTTGELMSFYACADIIFIGKSLTDHGGQNVIEPAVYAKPILVGPNMENFPVVMDDFTGANALVQVADENELREAIRGLVKDEERRRELGLKARQVVESCSGALSGSAESIARLLG